MCCKISFDLPPVCDSDVGVAPKFVIAGGRS
jgi:hypothetical protein